MSDTDDLDPATRAVVRYVEAVYDAYRGVRDSWVIDRGVIHEVGTFPLWRDLTSYQKIAVAQVILAYTDNLDDPLLTIVSTPPPLPPQSLN
jgi:hypothetical protein